MKFQLTRIFILFSLSIVFMTCKHHAVVDSIAEKATLQTTGYTPDSKLLYDSIVHMDSILFAAYNVCDLTTMAACFSEDIEFYHDKGGLMTNKDSIMAATKKYVCGKVTRVLIPGSVEVYPIANFGAIEMGQHYFINNEEPKTAQHHIGKFVHTWKKEGPLVSGGGKWKLTRVISLH